MLIVACRTESFASLVVGVKTSDVESSGRHGPCMDVGVLHHVVSQIARGIFSTAVFHAVANQVKVFAHIYIKRWNLLNIIKVELVRY